MGRVRQAEPGGADFAHLLHQRTFPRRMEKQSDLRYIQGIIEIFPQKLYINGSANEKLRILLKLSAGL